MSHALNHEQWGDLITLAVLAVTFWELFRVMVTRTWKWERLGIALDILIGALAFAFTEQAAAAFLGRPSLLPLVGRYVIRVVLILAGLLTILVLRFDEPTPPPAPPRRHHHPFGSESERTSK